MPLDPTAWEISGRGATVESDPIDVANVVPARASVVTQAPSSSFDSLPKYWWRVWVFACHHHGMRRSRIRPEGKGRAAWEQSSAAIDEDRLMAAAAAREDLPTWRMHPRQRRAVPHMPACRYSVCVCLVARRRQNRVFRGQFVEAPRRKGDGRAERRRGETRRGACDEDWRADGYAVGCHENKRRKSAASFGMRIPRDGARPTPFPCSSMTGICIIISAQGLPTVCKDSSSWR